MPDYKDIGLKVGLELHQQLDTRRKLFCHCPPVIRDDAPDGTFVRRLRPTQSEMGEVDPAALFEFKKKKLFCYEYYSDTTCLVEADEEPPHEMCEDAIDICLTMATFLDAKPVDEIHPMRKIVIDGSNTSGFQRTAVIAMDGHMVVNTTRIGIQTICLEEDAARKMSEDDRQNMRVYRLDRLGIPLIEIATAPDITSPEAAQQVAFQIGYLLRSTGRVKRGLGTIRQDINVSIRNGAVTEIKGLQELGMLARVVELEALRQLRLLEIRDELQRRDVTASSLTEDIHDVTDVFVNSKSKVIRRTTAAGGVVLALRLPGFAGLVGRELQPGRRFGTELADYARFWGGVSGLFHTDELPKYGISEDEVLQLREAVRASPDDAVIIVAAPYERAKAALKAVADRARVALCGVPAETRTPLPDGGSKYARPRPGAERMYPETDVRPVVVTAERLERIRRMMPETLEAKQARFVRDYGLSEELASKLVRSVHWDEFEEIVSKTGASPTLVASTLLDTLVSLHRDNVPTERLAQDHLVDLFIAISRGTVDPKAIVPILSHLAENPTGTVDDAVNELGLRRIDMSEVSARVAEIVRERVAFVLEHREHALSGLMGVAMKELRGRVDGKVVRDLIAREIETILSDEGPVSE